MNTSNLLTVQENSTSSRRRGLRRLLRDRRGANFAEYLVLIAVVALAGGAIFAKFVSGMSTNSGKAADAVGKLIK